MIHPPGDEILERLWYAKEEGRSISSIEELKLDGESSAAAQELIDSNQIHCGDAVELRPDGEERARGIVRRHRLAEILFAHVLETDPHDAERSACEFEHMLSERVVDRVCTFLGHPPNCPHGKPIPQGGCCRVYSRKVEPLITRLVDLPLGATGQRRLHRAEIGSAAEPPGRVRRRARLGSPAHRAAPECRARLRPDFHRH